MAEEIKEIKQTDQSSKNDREKVMEHHSDSDRALKIVLIIIGAVFVLGGLATAAKFAYVGHNQNIRTGRFQMMEGRGFERSAGRGNCLGADYFQVGVSGTITAISGDKITVKTSSKDQVVNIADDTSIIKDRAIAAKGDLKINDEIAVRGPSNSAGEIVASLIRVQPS